MLIYLFLSAYNAVEETLEEEIKAALTAKEKEKPSNRSVAFVGVLGANKLNYYFNTCKLMMLLLIFGFGIVQIWYISVLCNGN